MREVIYGEKYFSNFGFKSENYADSGGFHNHFSYCAGRIAQDFGPQTVLDAGCATGILVAKLRDLGIEAYGIDISEYAVSQAREDLRDFVEVCSLTNPLPDHFPKRFDLVVNIEVVEHMRENEAEAAIQNLCSYGDSILFSSSMDDFDDPTHFNVQQPEYWANRFARYGFFRNVLYTPDYISKAAILFQKEDNLSIVIENYERLLRIGKPRPKNNAQIYFDTGNGFSEENTVNVSSRDHSYVRRIPLPENTKALRFDPVDGSFCIVKKLQITCERGNCTPIALNGFPCGEFDLFATSDPQYLVEMPTDMHYVDISASIYPLADPVMEEAFVNLASTFVKYQDEEKRHREALDNAGLREKQMVLSFQKIQAELKAQSASKDALAAELAYYQAMYHATLDERNAFENQYMAIRQSFFWRLTKPARVVITFIKRICRRLPLIRNFYAMLGELRRVGLRGRRERIRKEKEEKRLSRIEQQRKTALGIKPVVRALIKADAFAAQRNTAFSCDIKFSIITPLYNTPIAFLKDMIESVQSQTYTNWELCLADGSDTLHNDVKTACEAYIAADGRINYIKLEKNEGIAGNTNRAIELARGDYIALLDHDDILHPSALYEMMKVLNTQDADLLYTDEATFSTIPDNPHLYHYKPDYAPDTLRSNNYICHFSAYRRSILDDVGHYRPQCDGSQDHDMMLRITEKYHNIVHIPKILYFWRGHDNSVAQNASSKPYVASGSRIALADHLSRIGWMGEVMSAGHPGFYRISYALNSTPLVSIIIPNKDNIDQLKICIDSISHMSSYVNYEILIVENNSIADETFAYYDELRTNGNIRILHWEGPFNYSAINNFGAANAKGDYLILLNNDTRIITPVWIEEMLMFAQRDDVGCVGAKLLYPDDTVQHAGIGLGLLTLAGHYHKNFPRSHPGYMGRAIYAQNVSAVTGACIMIRKRIYEEVGGLNDQLAVTFNDVDFCLRVRKAGYLNVFTPFAELYHYESQTRGLDDTPEKAQRFNREVNLFRSLWHNELNQGDPFYNPNLTLDSENFAYKENAEKGW